jgi:hypothetical protein
LRNRFLGLAAALAVVTVIVAGLMPAVARASDGGGGGNNCGNWGGQSGDQSYGLQQSGGSDCWGGGDNNCGNWGGQGDGLQQSGGNDCWGGGDHHCGNWGGQGDGLVRFGGNDCSGGGHHHCGNSGDWGSQGDQGGQGDWGGGQGDGLLRSGGRPDCDPPAPVPAAVYVAPTHNMYVCYSKWQVEPMAVSMDEGKSLIASGYWMPWAVKNGTTATTIGNNYHLQCNLGPSQTQGVLAVGGGGEEYSGAQAQNLFASNPDDFYHDAG